MPFEIHSDAFATDREIPRRHTADGEDLSPPLSWSGTPEGTVELALVVDDPDAPTEQPWVHWVVGKVPLSATALPEGFHGERVPTGHSALVQGRNSWGTLGYRGPAPPRGHGVHHYHFQLYALDTALDLAPGVEKASLIESAAGHILGVAETVGTYQR